MSDNFYNSVIVNYNFFLVEKIRVLLLPGPLFPHVFPCKIARSIEYLV